MSTDREVVRQIILLTKTAGPSEITVYDHVQFKSSGWSAIVRATKSAGADYIELGTIASNYVSKSIPGVDLKYAQLGRVLEEADVLINVPILKTHGLAEVTIGLKNHLGTVLDPRGRFHPSRSDVIHQRIADLNTCPMIRSKHSLTIVDALSPIVYGGPGHGVHANYNGVIAGIDPVATDYIGTQIMRRYNPGLTSSPLHIEKAAAHGLGTNDPNQIVFDERDVSAHIPELSLPLAIAGMAGMATLARRSNCSGREGV
jgi:uncharacterized protein (DUF362 family)